MVLLRAYDGDPKADGRTVIRTRWKDGSIQGVVLVPLYEAHRDGVRVEARDRPRA